MDKQGDETMPTVKVVTVIWKVDMYFQDKLCIAARVHATINFRT